MQCVSYVYAVIYRVVCIVMQKTTFEMRISDWSSDVCSSDLLLRHAVGNAFLSPFARIGQVCSAALHSTCSLLTSRHHSTLLASHTIRITRMKMVRARSMDIAPSI